MNSNPDAALDVALQQRQRKLDEERQILAERQMVEAEEARVLQTAVARVRMVLQQLDAAQTPVHGVPLAVALLGDLERLLQWCEQQVVLQQARVEAARGVADEARVAVGAAHQSVRALELVLEARAAERADKARRVELRLADETAARVHAQNGVNR